MCTHKHTHACSFCAPSKQERAACERATFLFQSASGDRAKGLLLLTGEIRRGGGLGVAVMEGAGWLQRLAEPALFFFSYRMEAPLSIGTHLPCCVIVAHNGAHLIQPGPRAFLFSEAIFSPIHQPNKSWFGEILRSLLSPGPPHICLLNGLFCVIKIKLGSVLTLKKKKVAAVKQFDIQSPDFSPTYVNNAADLSCLVWRTCSINDGHPEIPVLS